MDSLIPAGDAIPPDTRALIAQLQAEMAQANAVAQASADQAKKKAYWSMGKHIRKDILKNKARAQYSQELFQTLTTHLRIGKRTLYWAVQFNTDYPSNLQALAKLTWSHITVLLSIPDKTVRHAYEKKTIEEHLSTRDLKELIRADKGLPTSDPALKALSLTRGEPFLYQLKNYDGEPCVDLGFSTSVLQPPPDKLGRIRLTTEATPAHYTYQAKVLEVVDGDTLWVRIHLGLGPMVNQKLRLRGIDAPELGTPEGDAAKTYVTQRLSPCPFIIVKTYWRDKFTRYLADIFFGDETFDAHEIAANGTFLNQELLDKGYALPY